MTAIKRINPADVVTAFETTGLHPREGQFFSPDRTCACGLGAFYLANVSDKKTDLFEVINYFDENYGADYRAGFANGFDNTEKVYISSDDLKSPLFQAGYADGRKVRELLNMEVK
jgi:hypothetical protein